MTQEDMQDLLMDLGDAQEALADALGQAREVIRRLPRSDARRARAEAYWLPQLKGIISGRGNVTMCSLDDTLAELEDLTYNEED